MVVPFLDVAALHAQMRPELDDAVRRVLDSGSFVLGEEVARFEEEFARFVGARECVAVGNGLDALHLALRARGIGPGDEVLVPSHTFIATWLAVDLAGAVPVPVEPAQGSYVMDVAAAEAAVTPRTRAVVPVHLYGEPADLVGLRALCSAQDLFLLEDAAQAHGARIGEEPVGRVGTSTWSFYPGKNLGALGDGGAVTTDDPALAARVRSLRNYGSSSRYVHDEAGVNSRLDELQAALLRVKLGHLGRHQQRRHEIAARYLAELKDVGLELPVVRRGGQSSWHLFVVRSPQRDELQRRLLERGVITQVHYPLAVHQQKAYADRGFSDADLPLAAKYAAQVLSLPIDPTMSEDAVGHVVEAVRRSCEELAP